MSVSIIVDASIKKVLFYDYTSNEYKKDMVFFTEYNAHIGFIRKIEVSDTITYLIKKNNMFVNMILVNTTSYEDRDWSCRENTKLLIEIIDKIEPDSLVRKGKIGNLNL